MEYCLENIQHTHNERLTVKRVYAKVRTWPVAVKECGWIDGIDRYLLPFCQAQQPTIGLEQSSCVLGLFEVDETGTLGRTYLNLIGYNNNGRKVNEVHQHVFCVTLVVASFSEKIEPMWSDIASSFPVCSHTITVSMITLSIVKFNHR